MRKLLIIILSIIIGVIGFTSCDERSTKPKSG